MIPTHRILQKPRQRLPLAAPVAARLIERRGAGSRRGAGVGTGRDERLAHGELALTRRHVQLPPESTARG